MSLRFDHIAFAASSLEAAQSWARSRFGQGLPRGGQHPAMATHNLLTKIGPAQFLEVIAVDPEATPPNRPRWFALDDPDEQARLAAEKVRPHALVLACDDLDAALARSASLGLDLGEALALSRGDLHWRFAVRPDGAMAPFGFGPLLLQWPDLPHPANRMRDIGLRLQEITLTTPDPDQVESWITGMGGIAEAPPIKVVHGPADRIDFAIQATSDVS